MTASFTSVDYFTNFQLFGSHDAQLLCSYKHFIESVIMKLGEDWRIQSSLFVQEITAQPNLSRDMNDFNLFNEFLSAFLKRKLGNEYQYAKYSESQIQDNFLDEVTNLFQEQSILGSLTFKTLSLGYCITANDVWNKIFRNSPEKNTKKIQIFKPLGKLKAVASKQSGKENQLEIATISSRLQENEENEKAKEVKTGTQQPKLNKQSLWQWCSFQNDEVSQSKVEQLRQILSKLPHDPSKSQMLSYFVCFVDQIRTPSYIARVCSLCKDFYMNAFTIWLIFSIKMYFSLNSADYLRYCRELMSGWQSQYEKPLRAFQTMLEREWNKLMKDYRVALHDDFEVLNMLIERVRKEMQNEWEAKIISVTQTFSLPL